MLDNFTFVVAVRKGSKRVKNKNIKKFGDSSLIELKLDQIRRLFKSVKILVSSDCPKCLKVARKYNVMIDVREKKYASNLIPMKQVYKYLAKKVKTKFVCYLHVTSPFLKDITLKKSINLFTKNLKKFNSLATVTTLKEYMWQNGKPLNYNPNNHPRSQDLKKTFALNFAVNIVTTEYMRRFGRITSDKYYPVVIDFPENIDIDNKWQFIIGDYIKKNTNKFFNIRNDN
jgi:CMP-N-acetylneuraminic acid synthetase